MAAHDATSLSASSVSEASFQWTHTPVGTPAGVLVFVFNSTSITGTVSVTYGGVTVPAVSGGAAFDLTGEPGFVVAHFLGDISIIPTGAQTVVVTRTNNASVMYGSCQTQTATTGYGTAVDGVTLTEGDGTVAEVSVTSTGSANAIRYAGAFFGHQTLPTIGASSTLLQSVDIGATGIMVARETTAGTGARSVGFSSATTDDRAIVSLAVRETPVPARGALTLAGTVAVLALSMFPSVGAMSLTGHAPTVSIGGGGGGGTTAQPTAGTLTLSGQRLTVGFKGPDTGALTLSGQPITVGFTGPSTGALSLTGRAPTAFVSGGGGSSNITRTPAAAALALTGQAPTVAQAGVGVIAIGAGSLALTGQELGGISWDALDEAVLTLTGHAPTVQRGHRVNPAAGSLALTGQSLTVTNSGGTLREPAAGTLSLAGTTPTLTFAGDGRIPVGPLTLSGQRVSVGFQGPSTGSLSLVGQSVSVSVGVGGGGLTISPAVGTLTLTGQELGGISWDGLDEAALTLVGQSLTVSVSGGTAVTRNPAAGALTFTGQAPVRLVNHIAAPAVGSLTITGQALTAAGSGALPVAAGTLTLAGQAPIMSRGLPIGAQALTLTGQAPSALVAHVAQPAAGSLSLSGQAVTLLGTGAISPAAGTLTLSGQSVRLALTQSMTVGALTLTGQAPTARVGLTISPAAGALTFTGQAPALSSPVVIAIGAGSLTLSGTTPSTGGTVTIAVGSGALTLSGQTPTRHVAITVAIAAGSLTFAGQAPSLLSPVTIAIGAGSLTLTGQTPTRTFGTLEPQAYFVVPSEDRWFRVPASVAVGAT